MASSACRLTTAGLGGYAARISLGFVLLWLWLDDLEKCLRGQDHTVFGEATPFAYSCLTEVADESKIGVLWETGMEGCKGPSCRSVFSTVAK